MPKICGSIFEKGENTNKTLTFLWYTMRIKAKIHPFGEDTDMFKILIVEDDRDLNRST